MRIFLLKRLMGFASIADGVFMILTPFRPALALRVAKRIARRRGRIMFPSITSDTLGIGPRKDGKGNIRCDICKKLKPAERVYVSPGDGFVECFDCEPPSTAAGDLVTTQELARMVH